MGAYNELVGKRLRSIRKQRGLSLQDVQRLSEQEFKAAMLGAYERGERSLSLPRLQRLAEFYSETGQRIAALECLKKSEAMFQEMGMDYWLKKVQEAISKLQ